MTSETFSGPVNTRMKKEKLLAIAAALALDPCPSTVATLVDEIKKHLAQHPELAEDPKFQGLFVYRATNTLSKKQAKKSSDKTAEDVEESKKSDPSVAGAYRTLISQKYTTDPPAQHKRLEIKKGEEADSETKKGEVGESDTDEESDGSHTSDKDMDEDGERNHTVHEEETDDVILPSTPVRKRSGEQDHSASYIVIVKFQPKGTEAGAAAEEVLVEAKGDLIETDDRKVFMTSLSKLVPLALSQMSPKKASDARIWRPGFTQPENSIQIGSIASFLSEEKPRALNMEAIDEYKLQMGENGMLICDLFIESSDTNASKALFPSRKSVSPMKPLHMAQMRKEMKEGLKPPRKIARFLDNDSGEFISFLKELLDVQPRPARAENVGLILERHMALENGYKTLISMKWGRAKGGYRVPSGYERYPGQEFTKIHVQQAFDIQGTLASNDAALFEPSKLINCPDILAWVESPDGDQKAKFGRMSTKKFREYIAQKDSQAQLRRNIREDSDDSDTIRKRKRKERKRLRALKESGEATRASKKQRATECNSDALDD